MLFRSGRNKNFARNWPQLRAWNFGKGEENELDQDKITALKLRKISYQRERLFLSKNLVCSSKLPISLVLWRKTTTKMEVVLPFHFVLTRKLFLRCERLKWEFYANGLQFPFQLPCWNGKSGVSPMVVRFVPGNFQFTRVHALQPVVTEILG